MNVLISIGRRTTRSSSIRSSSSRHLSISIIESDPVVLVIATSPVAPQLGFPHPDHVKTRHKPEQEIFNCLTLICKIFHTCWVYMTLAGWVLDAHWFGRCAPTSKEKVNSRYVSICKMRSTEGLWCLLFLFWRTATEGLVAALPLVLASILLQSRHQWKPRKVGNILQRRSTYTRLKRIFKLLDNHRKALLNSALSCFTTKWWPPRATNPTPYCVSSRASPTPKWSS